jgi:hypothetical protein
MKGRWLCAVVMVVGPLLSSGWWWSGMISAAVGQKTILSTGEGKATSQPLPNLTERERPHLIQNYGQMPLYFIENHGQVNKQVKYYARGNGHAMFFTRDGMVLTLARQTKAEGYETPGPLGLDQGIERRQPMSGEAIFKAVSHKFQDLIAPSLALSPVGPLSKGLDKSGMRQPFSGRKGRLARHRNHEKPAPVTASVVRMAPVGMQKKVKIKALQPQECKVNYFIGNDPQKWRTNIPTYAGVLYQEAYKGIDLKFYGNGRELEYDIVIQPGADPNQVRFSYKGVDKLEVTTEGDLALVLPDGGKLLQKKPLIYQEIAGQRVAVEGKFRLCRRGAQVNCGFTVAAYDKNQPLIIDPVLVYSTYLGGSGNDIGNGIAVDAAGQAYITGQTESPDFPITSICFQANSPGAFVTKFSANGQALIYSTYLGGSSSNFGYGIAVDAAGQAYIVGVTNSTNFPTHNPFQANNAGGMFDAFVTKLSANGQALIYSTYLGGTKTDECYSIAVDAAGQAYIVGDTSSTNFPTHNPFQASNAGGHDAFVTKLSADGQALVYSTYLGGSKDDELAVIAIDAKGHAYIAGTTYSLDFPTYNPFHSSYAGSGDAFVTKLSADGQALVYSTYLGGIGYDAATGITVDAGGQAYIVGETTSSNFPTTPQSFQTNYAAYYDAFVTKFSADGQALIYSTYLGGNDVEFCSGIAVDAVGQAYVVGSTYSTNFPLQNPLQPNRAGGGLSNAFVTKLRASGHSLDFSTCLGGGTDIGLGVALDTMGQVYIVGYTRSSNFPILNPFQPIKAGEVDTFVTKIGDHKAVMSSVLYLLLNDY